LSEKYLKKLIGKTDIEDSLKRLDKLTNEEVRMVTAQVLEATHMVEDRVLDVDNRVAGVDNNVKAIDDKIAVVIDGAEPFLISQQENVFNSGVSRGKRDKDGHTASGRRHGSSETLVVFFMR
jgi:hypothetical protein